MNKWVFYKPKDSEWEPLWALLKTKYGDIVQENEGEVWQYMGSELDSNGRATHHFRHRCHPSNGKRTFELLVAP